MEPRIIRLTVFFRSGSIAFLKGIVFGSQSIKKTGQSLGEAGFWSGISDCETLIVDDAEVVGPVIAG